MALLRTQITLDQRTGSSTVTATCTTTHLHSHQVVETRVRKFTARPGVLEDSGLAAQVLCAIERAVVDLNAELPF